MLRRADLSPTPQFVSGDPIVFEVGMVVNTLPRSVRCGVCSHWLPLQPEPSRRPVVEPELADS